MFRTRLTDDAEMRPLEPWQAEEFFTHIERARDHIAPWVPIPHRVVDVESARAYLQRYADLQARDAGRAFGIWVRSAEPGAPDLLVGGALFPQFSSELGSCEIGVWLEPSAEGKYLITSACIHLIDWAIRERGIVRVEWHANPRNERSRAVARRLHMSHEGTHRSSFLINGARQDTEVWAVLATEWRHAATVTHPG
jgi:RimJ/RimL family protein N-acetyltransferase